MLVPEHWAFQVEREVSEISPSPVWVNYIWVVLEQPEQATGTGT